MTYKRWLINIVGIPALVACLSEYLINITPMAESVRLKSISIMTALVIFVIMFAWFLFQNRPKFLSGLLVFAVGLVLLFFVGGWLWLFVACSTGPVCI
jgi:hypothetical protein